jgi:hypothetical protein
MVLFSGLTLATAALGSTGLTTIVSYLLADLRELLQEARKINKQRLPANRGAEKKERYVKIYNRFIVIRNTACKDVQILFQVAFTGNPNANEKVKLWKIKRYSWYISTKRSCSP